MSHDTPRSSSHLSRRTALSGVGVGAAALGLGHLNRAAAQDATPTAMAGHPFVGTWIIGDPTGGEPTTNIITADGGLIDPTVGAAGVWTATGARTADFTLIAIFAEDGGSYFLVRGSIDGRCRRRHRDRHGQRDARGGRRDRPGYAGAGHGHLPLPAPEGRTAERRGATVGRVPGLDAAAATPTP